jgi:hypothetical protein
VGDSPGGYFTWKVISWLSHFKYGMYFEFGVENLDNFQRKPSSVAGCVHT